MTQWGLDTLFNPAKRHMDEEKRRLQSTREEVGDTSGGRRIDLESGKVVIARDDEADETADGATAAGAKASGAKASGAKATDSAGHAPDDDELTPAQRRARERRARQKR